MRYYATITLSTIQQYLDAIQTVLGGRGGGSNSAGNKTGGTHTHNATTKRG